MSDPLFSKKTERAVARLLVISALIVGVCIVVGFVAVTVAAVSSLMGG